MRGLLFTLALIAVVRLCFLNLHSPMTAILFTSATFQPVRTPIE
jgi:hypothetical protein